MTFENPLVQEIAFLLTFFIKTQRPITLAEDEQYLDTAEVLQQSPEGTFSSSFIFFPFFSQTLRFWLNISDFLRSCS